MYVCTGLKSSLINTIQSTTDEDDVAAKHIKEKENEILVAKKSTFDSSSVISQFLNMKAQLEELLEPCNPIPIVNKCYSLLASDTHNIPLFTTEVREQLQEIEHTHDFIQKLSLFMTWDNHSILSIIAEASNIPEATMLLTQFDDNIDLSQPLTSFPIPAPSPHMVPYDNSMHTVLVVNLDLELHDCTLQDVIDARLLIQEQCKLTSHSFYLLAIAKTIFTFVYWLIPRSVAHLVTTNALQFQSLFHQKGILQLAVYPGAIISTGRRILNVEPLSCFTQTNIDSKMVCINCSYNYVDLHTFHIYKHVINMSITALVNN